MDRQPFMSSALQTMGYDPEAQRCEVEFNPNKQGEAPVWEYANVPPELWESVNVPGASAGKFVRQLKADPTAYPARRLR